MCCVMYHSIWYELLNGFFSHLFAVFDSIRKRKQELEEERLPEFAPPTAYMHDKGSDTKKIKTERNEIDLNHSKMNKETSNNCVTDPPPHRVTNVTPFQSSSNDYVTQPPSSNDYVTQPPPSNDYVTQPPSSNDYVTQPPSSNDYVTQPPPHWVTSNPQTSHVASPDSHQQLGFVNQPPHYNYVPPMQWSFVTPPPPPHMPYCYTTGQSVAPTMAHNRPPYVTPPPPPGGQYVFPPPPLEQ